MGSLDLQFWTHIGTMNLAGAPDSDPARRKGHFHRAASECGAPVHGKPRPPTLDAHWDHEPGRSAGLRSGSTRSSFHRAASECGAPVHGKGTLPRLTTA